MAEITATMVKTLREETGVGMMDCKKALQEADGDLDKARKLLREKGAAKAVKRAGRAAKEGRIAAEISQDARKGALVEVNIETDFAARNERFGALVETVGKTALQCECGSLNELLQAKPVGSDAETVQQAVTDAIGVIGENMSVGRCDVVKVPEGQEGLVHSYIHPPGKVGVLVALGAENAEAAKNPATDDLAHEICLQIAFSNPAGIDAGSVPESVVASEREIFRNQALQSGKPENIVDKIVEGRVKAFFKENCLVEQPFVKDEDKTVAQLIDETARQAGGALKVLAFVRYELGAAGPEAADEA